MFTELIPVIIRVIIGALKVNKRFAYAPKEKKEMFCSFISHNLSYTI